ncbi:MAG TPA: serine/threonine-protein kinase, partial [Isosphaeraceae bacterium]|nr:serine/threonine-protein kinase [Isosphaeraceae bacterium]
MPEHPTDPQLPDSDGPNTGLTPFESQTTSQDHPLPSSLPTGLDQPATEPQDDLDASAYARTLFGPSLSPGVLGQLDHYNVLRLVGRGAMGLVFQAYDTKLQRIVAIKMLAAHLATTPTARRRFLREARAAAAISHPNVVTVFGVGEHRDVPYLITEFVGGGSLSQTIHAQAPIEPERLARLGAQIALGLAEAHARGVIHRDIKPANLLLEDGACRIKISDFGLAQVLLDPSESASPGQHAGTPTYMAPEIIAGENATPRSDLFSLGCVLYAMVLGRSPFA